LDSSGEDPLVNDTRWTEILPIVNLGPSSRHLFKILESFSVNYVKLKMYPDGGIVSSVLSDQWETTWNSE